MILLWEIDEDIKGTMDPELTDLLQSAADKALETEGVTRSCAVTVRLCGDEAIHQINKAFRGVDRSTDVLSFPTINYPTGITAGQADKLIRREYDDELNACMLGDLIISVPHIMAQADEYGHSPRREAAYLLVHGICHLMGYDHMQDDEKTVMRAMEERILSAVNMTREEC